MTTGFTVNDLREKQVEEQWKNECIGGFIDVRLDKFYHTRNYSFLSLVLYVPTEDCLQSIVSSSM